MKFAYFLGLAFTVAIALAGCRPDFGPAPDDVPAMSNQNEGSNQAGFHFLSQVSCEDAYWTCSGLWSHLTPSTNPRMVFRWLRIADGSWRKYTLIYTADGTISNFGNQYFATRYGASTSWCLEASPNAWGSQWGSNNVPAGCPCTTASCGEYFVAGEKFDSFEGSEGVTYPYVQASFVRVISHHGSGADQWQHSYITYDSLHWTKEW